MTRASRIQSLHREIQGLLTAQKKLSPGAKKAMEKAGRKTKKRVWVRVTDQPKKSKRGDAWVGRATFEIKGREDERAQSVPILVASPAKLKVTQNGKLLVSPAKGADFDPYEYDEDELDEDLKQLLDEKEAANEESSADEDEDEGDEESAAPEEDDEEAAFDRQVDKILRDEATEVEKESAEDKEIREMERKLALKKKVREAEKRAKKAAQELAQATRDAAAVRAELGDELERQVKKDGPTKVGVRVAKSLFRLAGRLAMASFNKVASTITGAIKQRKMQKALGPAMRAQLEQQLTALLEAIKKKDYAALEADEILDAAFEEREPKTTEKELEEIARRRVANLAALFQNNMKMLGHG